jgi:RHS repeat-associated protein
VLTNTGTLVNREEYYPFGETCFGAFAKKRYRYVGKEKDNESGLYYYGARYYAAWTCRFISVDPLAGDYPHYTPYQYAGNKPINFIDLDGLEEAEPEQKQSTAPSTTPKQSSGNPIPLEGDGKTASPNTVTQNIDPISALELHMPDALSVGGYTDRLPTIIPSQLPATKRSEGESNISTAVGLLAITADMIKEVGGLEAAQKMIEEGKFEAIYNGEKQTWSMKFHGNQHVSASFVEESKVAFADKAKLSGKVLASVKVAGGVFNVVGIAILADNVKKNGWTPDNKMDAGISAIAFIPQVGWGLALILTGAKYGAKEMDKMVKEWNNTSAYFTTNPEDQFDFNHQYQILQQQYGINAMDHIFE